MQNFRRALRLAARLPMNALGIVLSSLAVALLWGGNLTAVFPVVDVIMTDRSLPQWIDDEIATSEAKAADQRQEWERLKPQLPEESDRSDLAMRQRAEAEEARFLMQLHTQRAEKFRWMAPLARKWLPTTPFDTLMVICGLVVVGTLIKSTFRILNMILVARLALLVGYDLRKQFYGQMLRLDVRNFNEQGRGDLMNRCTTDLNGVSHGVQTLAGHAVLEPLKMAVCMGIAAYVSWRLLLLTMIVAPLAGFAIYWLARALKRAHRRAMQELSTIYESLAETLSGIQLIKAFTMEPYERTEFRSSARLYYRRQMKTARYNALVSPITEMLGVLMIVLAAVAGGYLVLGRQTHILGIKISDTPLTHGWMSIFFAMMAGMSDPARRLSAVFGTLQQSAAACDRVFEVLDREPDISDPPHPKPLPTLRQAIRFEDVNFNYLPEKQVLSEVNLEIPAGETIAVVGPNGCGKSTLLQLLLRFYDPGTGRITIDDVDLRDVRTDDLRGRIGLVSQETLMVNDTVAHNIAYGNLEASQQTIEAAARQAHARIFISKKLADGYNTVVGPGGNRLSGGQRQRIALARAILRDPEILILDEATSQIDLESEQLIHQVLKDFLRNRTALVVTHRMSTISLANRIVVMDSGRVLDVGTHEQLTGRCDLYHRLCQLGYRESA